MSDKFGERIANYKDIYFLEKIHYYEIYGGYNKILKKEVSLKIIKKEQFKDKDLLLKNVKNEEKILKECKSDNILDFYSYFETKDNIIFEQEYYQSNLREYIMENGPSNYDLGFFKKVVLGVSNALKTLHKKGVIHRNIRTSSIFLVNNKVKLGEFGTAIFKKDNISEPLNSIFYTAPEIINGEKYDERCDLWSFGIALYELYFGTFPFGFKPSRHLIIKALSDESSFHFEKTNISSIDYLFEGLLKIDPKKRMTHEKLIDFVFNNNFMNENETTIIKKKSSSEILFKSIISYNYDSDSDSNKSLSSSSISLTEDKPIYNNILYYDENTGKNVKNDCNKFEKETLGGFIKCTNMNELEQIKKEILNENKKYKNIKFNLIITGSSFEQIMNYIHKDKAFENCFEHYCIYCIYLEKYENLKDKYAKLNDVYNSSDDVIQFIKNTSNNKIRPFKINKLFNIDNCDKEILKMNFFYKNMNNIDFNQYYEEIKKYIEKKSKENKLEMAEQILIKAFNDFAQNDDVIIIKNFSDILYDDFNNFIYDTCIYSKDCIEYFKARILKSFKHYKGKSNYQWKDNPLYMVKKLYLSDFLKYKRAKGMIISTNFSKFYKNKELAATNINSCHRSDDNNLKLSVYFILNNDKKLPDYLGFNIEDIDKGEFVFYMPFSLFKLKEIKYDLKKMIAEIYLEIF